MKFSFTGKEEGKELGGEGGNHKAGTSPMSSQVILITRPLGWEGGYYYPHFTDENTEALRC